MRRSTYSDAQPVSYGSVGVTQTADFLDYPPKGFRSSQLSARLGSGEERFRSAVEAVMTWAVHRASGVNITDLRDRSVTADSVERKDRRSSGVQNPGETIFAADGTPYLTNGSAVVLTLSFRRWRLEVPVRVVSVIDEPRRVGFVYGTLVDHPVIGEESLTVELRGDDSVWFTVRSCTRVTMRIRPLASFVFRFLQKRYLERFVRVLVPGQSTQS